MKCFDCKLRPGVYPVIKLPDGRILKVCPRCKRRHYSKPWMEDA